MRKLLILTITILSIISCKKEDEIVIPLVTINGVNEITSNSAICIGEITDDGGEIPIRGVCWSINQLPTTNDSKMSIGAGLGSFTSTITGLSPGTIYNIRAYGTNSVGTGYSSQLTFTTLAKFEIIDIKCSSSKIVYGQRNIFRALLSDSIGNINYEWKLFYNNLQVGNTLSGFDIKTFTLNTEKVGEYTLRLTITRGVYDKSIFEKKIFSIQSNFQYGVWGDNEQTIKNAEEDNGNTIQTGLFRKPVISPEVQNLTTFTYHKKDGISYTYYFKNGKLYAGAYIKDYVYNGLDTDAQDGYIRYYMEKKDLESILKIELPDGKIWIKNDPVQIALMDQDHLSRWKAIGYGFLQLKSEGTSSYGKGSIHLFRTQTTTTGDNYIEFEYTLVSPN
jgi:hypothetical protein